MSRAVVADMISDERVPSKGVCLRNFVQHLVGGRGLEGFASGLDMGLPVPQNWEVGLEEMGLSFLDS